MDLVLPFLSTCSPQKHYTISFFSAKPSITKQDERPTNHDKAWDRSLYRRSKLVETWSVNHLLYSTDRMLLIRWTFHIGILPFSFPLNGRVRTFLDCRPTISILSKSTWIICYCSSPFTWTVDSRPFLEYRLIISLNINCRFQTIYRELTKHLLLHELWIQDHFSSID